MKGRGECKRDGSEGEGERAGRGGVRERGGRKGDHQYVCWHVYVCIYTPALCRRPSCGVVRAEVLTCAALALLSL